MSPALAVMSISFVSLSVVLRTSVAVILFSACTNTDPSFATTLVSVVTPSLRSSTFPAPCASIARNSTAVVPRLFT